MSTTTRQHATVTITDADRSIDLTLEVAYDLNGDGEVEYPTVTEFIEGTAWFGKWGVELTVVHTTAPGERAICEDIETRYAAEILEAVREVVRKGREQEE